MCRALHSDDGVRAGKATSSDTLRTRKASLQPNRAREKYEWGRATPPTEEKTQRQSRLRCGPFAEGDLPREDCSLDREGR